MDVGEHIGQNLTTLFESEYTGCGTSFVHGWFLAPWMSGTVSFIVRRHLVLKVANKRNSHFCRVVPS